MATIKMKFITADEELLNLADNTEAFIARYRELRDYLRRASSCQWTVGAERVPGGVLLTLKSDRCRDVVHELKTRLLECFYNNYKFDDKTLKYSATCSQRYQPNITNCGQEDIDMSDCCEDFYSRPYRYTFAKYRLDKRIEAEEEDMLEKTLGRIAGDSYPDE